MLSNGRKNEDLILVINSEARSSGTPQQYTVPINPPIHDVLSVELMSFDCVVKSWNVIEDTVWSVSYSNMTGFPIPVFSWFTTIKAGVWILDDLLLTLNTNPYVLFSWDRISGKIIISQTGVAVSFPSSLNYTWSAPSPINELLGFPRVTTVPIINAQANWVIDGLPRSIQSVLPVNKSIKPLPIQIAFESIPGHLSSSNNIGGCFVVCVPEADPVNLESVVQWRKSADFAQKVKCNHIRFSSLGIRLCDSVYGSPYKYPGEHTIVLKVRWNKDNSQY